jgi:phosphoglycolate phosphatase
LHFAASRAKTGATKARNLRAQMGRQIKAVIFDKDGTLFDFRQSWGAWTKSLLAELGGDPVALADLLGFDAKAMDFAPDSPVIAMTTPEIAEILHPHLPDLSLSDLNALMNRQAAAAPMVPAVDLPAVLGDLARRGLALGLATNDTEIPARRHLANAGVIDLFSFVSGCDSGWGGKPAPGQLMAFIAQTGLPADQIAMVGDSLHDLDAGRSAGMATVAVLTGIATEADLGPHADVVLQDISALAGWIEAQAQG